MNIQKYVDELLNQSFTCTGTSETSPNITPEQMIKKLNDMMYSLKRQERALLNEIRAVESFKRFWQEMARLSFGMKTDPLKLTSTELLGIKLIVDDKIPNGFVELVYSDGRRELKRF